MPERHAKKQTVGGLFAGAIRKKITGEIQRKKAELEGRYQQAMEREAEMAVMLKHMEEVNVSGMRLKPKNQMELQRIMYELQQGVFPSYLLKSSGIRKYLMKNPAKYRELFDLIYKYYSGAIKKPEMEKLKKILTKTVGSGINEDMKTRGNDRAKQRRVKEISKIQQNMRHLSGRED
ncbi:MAG: hypothetical protein ABH986_05465 [archaeon]